MGDSPWLKNPEAHKGEARAYGFNSPFEEFAFALEMSRNGVRTVYPRAIYMTGRQRGPARQVSDERRYAALAEFHTPDGEPVARREYDYITIWGFWNGPDELLAAQDGKFYQAFNVKRAFTNKLISEQTLTELIQMVTRRLGHCGFEDLNLKPDHLLISFDSEQKLVLDTMGKPELRLCNFELLRRRP
jgi:hypothetical protein